MSIDDKVQPPIQQPANNMPTVNTSLKGIYLFETDKSNDYKFVQLYVGEKPYLRIGSHHDPHLILLLDFFRECNEHGTPIYSEDEILDMLDNYIASIAKPKKQLPSLQTDKYHVVGMGVVSVLVYGEDKEMTFGGYSFDFGLKPNQQHLEKIKPYLPSGWEARILNMR